MHETIFAKAVLPDYPIIMKLAMRPYSIGHDLILIRTSNPLITYSAKSFDEVPEPERRRKLFSAVFICSRSWKENRCEVKWPRLTGFFRRDCKTDIEIEKFRIYRNEGGQEFPTTQPPRVRGAAYHYFGAPEATRLLPFIAHERLFETFGFETPFDFPLGLARQLYLSYLECEGSIWVKNHIDSDTDARLKAFEKQNPESTLAVGWDEVQKSAERWNKEHPDNPVTLPDKPKK